MSLKSRPIIAVTMGDAAGVGPELCLHLLGRTDLPSEAVPLIIGDWDVLARVAKQLQIPFEVPQLDSAPDTLETPSVFDPPGSLAGHVVEPGRNQKICGKAAIRYIEEAVKGCLAGRFAAMVTAPISKKALSLAGCDFPGHTEMLGYLTRCSNYAMLLYSHQIACAFATCHQPLRSVSDSLSAQRIVDVAELASSSIAAIRGTRPHMALLGLNPHAGEEGLFGDEEQRFILPAKAILEKSGYAVEGPLPADTAFTTQALKRIGCHIAMYHDQGSIPFKMLAFDSGVNVTMGLPIIRTSPDHGTAFDIAWQGRVKPDSFLCAYLLAVQLCGSEVRVDDSGLHKLG
jgi:4-hydroxythreonine-4-phosphate dehydrogenase